MGIEDTYITLDGDQYCCTAFDTRDVNIQEQAAGFGDTPEEAFQALLREQNT